jgi:nucleolar protein 4
VRQAFAPAGFVWELTLPRSTGGRGRGFAFVGFTCRTHAERAIQLVNGTAIAGRPVAVDWALSKAQYGPAAQPGESAKEAPASLDDKLAGLRRQEIAEALGLDSDDEGAGPPATLVSWHAPRATPPHPIMAPTMHECRWLCMV